MIAALVDTTDPHIQVLWVVQVLATYFSDPSAFYRTVVVFIHDIVEGMNPPYVMVDTFLLTL